MRGTPKRQPVDKFGARRHFGSAKHFRKDVARTHVKNVAPRPMRGGIRL